MLLREHERAFFTDRSEILAALHHNAELTRQGKGVNPALVGQHRIGKTILAQRFADGLSERDLIELSDELKTNVWVPIKEAEAKGVRRPTPKSQLGRIWRILRAVPAKLQSCRAVIFWLPKS